VRDGLRRWNSVGVLAGIASWIFVVNVVFIHAVRTGVHGCCRLRSTNQSSEKDALRREREENMESSLLSFWRPASLRGELREELG